MLILEDYSFPRLGIGNITLEKNSIDIKAFITATNDSIRTLRKDDTGLSSYAKVYFIVSAPKSPNDPRHLPLSMVTNPRYRVGNISKFLGLSNDNSLGWYEKVKQIYYSNCFSLKDIYENIGKITPSEISPTSRAVDLNFDISVPIEEELYQKLNTDEIYLHAFVQFDILTMINSGIINRVSNSIKEYLRGGNINSKKILERTELGLQPVQFRKGLVTQSGQPFYGNFRKQRGKFISTKTGEELRLLQSPEFSISANYFVNKDASFTGNRCREEVSKQLDYSYTKPILEFNKTDLPIEIDTNQIYNSEYFEATKELFFKRQISDPKLNYISNAVHMFESVPNLGNKIRFDINWEKLIKNKTKYGYLIDVVNKNVTINNLITIFGVENKRFNIENVLKYFYIKQISIQRSRIDRKIENTTKLGTKKLVAKEPITVLSTSNFTYEEGYNQGPVSLDTIRNNISTKTMLMTDTSLYTVAHEGEYEYSISLTIEDRMSEYFINLIQEARTKILQIDLHLMSVEKDPSTKKYLKNKDKVLNKNLKLNSSLDIPGMIDIYLLLLLWTGKEFTRQNLIRTRTNLFRMASHDSGGTVSGLYKFRNMSESMIYQLEKTLGDTVEKLVKSRTKSIGQKEGTNLTYHQEVIPGRSKSIPVDKVLVSYSPSNLSFPKVEPSAFLYRKYVGFGNLLSKSEIINQTNQTLIENRAIIVDNAIKNVITPSMAQAQMVRNNEIPETEFTSGIPGISVTTLFNNGEFIFGDPSERLETESSNEESKANLSSATKSSIVSSIPPTRSKTKLSNQGKKENIKGLQATLKKKITKKVLNMLSLVVDMTPMSTTDPNFTVASPSGNLVDKIFTRRSGLLTIGVPSSSGEMIFESLTIENLRLVQQEEIVVKIQEPTSKVTKENYDLINNVFTVPRSTLKNLLTQNR